MSWTTQTKMALASIIFRHRVLNRWAHKQLPKKRSAACILLFDDDGRLLIVKPSYRHHWLVPGGIVENNESPWTAARREAHEETGLVIEQLRLVVIDWKSSDDQYDDSLHYVFDGGRLEKRQQSSIRCDGVEIVEHRFAPKEEALDLLDPDLARRIMQCWDHHLDRPLMMNRGEPDNDTL